MTFSRRGASEMSRRVSRIVASVPGFGTSMAGAALSWAGTFHGIAARLLREYAERIGLSPNFTIHDREDSADLMNLVRHELGLSKTEKRFPTKGTCLQIYSRAVNAELPLDEVLGAAFPWCAEWEEQLVSFCPLWKQSSATLSSIRDDSFSTGRTRRAGDGADMGARFHILIDELGHQPAAGVIRRRSKPNGEGLLSSRRCAGDLRFRRDGAQ
jgi:DNA helicase-2/ATP-dependent DNA helicase PcrA